MIRGELGLESRGGSSGSGEGVLDDCSAGCSFGSGDGVPNGLGFNKDRLDVSSDSIERLFSLPGVTCCLFGAVSGLKIPGRSFGSGAGNPDGLGLGRDCSEASELC